jgi:tetratricopeptide (TPR) repeat protein
VLRERGWQPLSFFMDDPFKEAQKHHQEGNYAEAEKLYDLVLTQNWDHPGLLASMGTLFLQQHKHGLAISLLRRAIERVKQSDAMSNLALAYKGAGQTEEAIKWAEKACNVGKPSAMAYANYAGFFTNTGTPEKTIPLCEKALELDDSLSVAHWNLGLALLESGQWERGWKEHEWGLRMQKGASLMRVDRNINDLPYWDGTPGKPVAVYGEQGLGDEIMFASMIPDLMKTNPVVIECHHRLKNIFEKSFGVPCHGTREDKEITWPNHHPELAYRVSIGSLGQFYRNKAEDFPGTPYLKADPVPNSRS